MTQLLSHPSLLKDLTPTIGSLGRSSGRMRDGGGFKVRAFLLPHTPKPSIPGFVFLSLSRSTDTGTHLS